MVIEKIDRRKFLQLGLMAGLGGLYSCSSANVSSILTAPKGVLPKSLIRQLPTSWRFKRFKTSSSNIPFSNNAFKETDLIAFDDGWINNLPSNYLQSINLDQLNFPLDQKSRNFYFSFSNELSNLFLPIGVSPWVMLFRNGARWISSAKQSWNVLLDNSLKGKVLLPASPRLIISLSKNIDNVSILPDLINQTKIFDDQNALNWLVSGEVRVAVIPLSRCLRALRSDQRLSIALPNVGAPLNWTLLARPISSKSSIPIKWIEKTLTFPLIGQLLSEGWIPPMSRSKSIMANELLPNRYREIIFPSDEVWEKCWSLSPLTLEEDQRLLALWRKYTNDFHN